MRLGDLAHLTDRLKALGFSGTLNTAFMEWMVAPQLVCDILGGVLQQKLCPLPCSDYQPGSLK
jgi:hypothetical protein